MTDVGLTHVALTVTDMQRSLAFYAAYADLYEVHRRQDSASGADVAWITDGTRPFVVVLIQSNEVTARLSPLAHLGVGCRSRQEVIERCARATADGISVDGPTESGPPVGFWAFLRDPDGHTLELSYGQEIGLAVATPSNEQSK